MPNYKTHLVGGCCVFAIIFYCLTCLLSMHIHVSLLLGSEWLCFTLLGSLFPDIDIKSKGQKIFYTVCFCVTIIFLVQKLFFAATLLGLCSCIPLIVRHRGICHRPWFVIGVPLCCAWLCAICFPRYARSISWDAAFFSIGALSHVWLDVGLKRMMRIR